MYLLDTLNLKALFRYPGPLGTFWIPRTFRYLLDTLGLYVLFGYLNVQGSQGYLQIQGTLGYLGHLGTHGIPMVLT